MARTRSSSAHEKVIRAAAELIAERGIEGTSMDAIADSSAVSKATIYKHWADKDALLLEVLEEINGLKTRPVFDSGNIRKDIVAVLAYRPDENVELRNRMMPHFMAHSVKHTEFGDLWRKRVMEPPRRELTRLLNAGIKSGELVPVDLELSMAQLLGPIMYWHVFLRRSQENPGLIAEAVVDMFWRAFGTGQRTRTIS
ncbi:MAG TPA: TetR/AcrR family transcriptional regulator [Candidatus Angelobacter sp.]|nr:TetR/AcrR family transcriptional regulator [Candidatus Angelobacter sp.]